MIVAYVFTELECWLMWVVLVMALIIIAQRCQIRDMMLTREVREEVEKEAREKKRHDEAERPLTRGHSEESHMNEKHYQKLLAQALDEQERLLDVIEAMVKQHCNHGLNPERPFYDSLSISANADAMRVLTDHNRFITEGNSGRMVYGIFPNDQPEGKQESQHAS